MTSDVDNTPGDGLSEYSRLREPFYTPGRIPKPPERRATYYCMWCRWPLADNGRTRLEGLSYLHPGECALLRVCEECREQDFAPSVAVEPDEEF